MSAKVYFDASSFDVATKGYFNAVKEALKPEKFHTQAPTPQLLRKAQKAAVDLKRPIPCDAQGRILPHPSRGSKSEIFKKDDFKDVDYHALNAPASLLTANIEELVAYLVSPYDDDVSAVRAIFRWISGQDLRYYEIRDEVLPNCAAHFLNELKNGKGRYDKMFNLMCKHAQIPSATISGHSKGIGYNVGDPLTASTHNMWNAVLLGENWYLIDVHWASRKVSGVEAEEWQPVDFSRQKTKEMNIPHDVYEFDEFYFLTDPEEFIYSHFPDKEVWQLLARPLTLPEFQKVILLKPKFFEFDLKVKSHPWCTLKSVDGAVNIEINTEREDLSFSYELYRSTKVDSGQERLQNYLFLERNPKEKKLCVEIRFPTMGKFKAEIYGKDAKSKLEWLCSYVLYCEKAEANCMPLPPNLRSEWGPGVDMKKAGVTPLTHMRGKIFVDSETDIKFQLDHNVDMIAQLMTVEEENLDRYILLGVSDDIATVNMRIPQKGQYALCLFAKTDPSEKQFVNICNYLVICMEDFGEVERYPQTNNSRVGPLEMFHKLGLKTIDPLPGLTTTSQDGTYTLNVLIPQEIDYFPRMTLDGKKDDDFSDYVGWYRCGDNVNFNLRFPKPGFYKFSLFAKSGNNEGGYPEVLCIVLEVPWPMINCLPFPKKFSSYKDSYQIFSPNKRLLAIGKTEKVNVSLPDADEVAFIEGETWTHLQKNEDGCTWEGQIIPTGTAEIVSMAAKLSENGESFAAIMSFEMGCSVKETSWMVSLVFGTREKGCSQNSSCCECFTGVPDIGAQSITSHEHMPMDLNSLPFGSGFDYNYKDKCRNRMQASPYSSNMFESQNHNPYENTVAPYDQPKWNAQYGDPHPFSPSHSSIYPNDSIAATNMDAPHSTQDYSSPYVFSDIAHKERLEKHISHNSHASHTAESTYTESYTSPMRNTDFHSNARDVSFCASQQPRYTDEHTPHTRYSDKHIPHTKQTDLSSHGKHSNGKQSASSSSHSKHSSSKTSASSHSDKRPSSSKSSHSDSRKHNPHGSSSHPSEPASSRSKHSESKKSGRSSRVSSKDRDPSTSSSISSARSRHRQSHSDEMVEVSNLRRSNSSDSKHKAEKYREQKAPVESRPTEEENLVDSKRKLPREFSEIHKSDHKRKRREESKSTKESASRSSSRKEKCPTKSHRKKQVDLSRNKTKHKDFSFLETDRSVSLEGNENNISDSLILKSDMVNESPLLTGQDLETDHGAPMKVSNVPFTDKPVDCTLQEVTESRSIESVTKEVDNTIVSEPINSSSTSGNNHHESDIEDKSGDVEKEPDKCKRLDIETNESCNFILCTGNELSDSEENLVCREAGTELEAEKLESLSDTHSSDKKEETSGRSSEVSDAKSDTSDDPKNRSIIIQCFGNADDNSHSPIIIPCYPSKNKAKSCSSASDSDEDYVSRDHLMSTPSKRLIARSLFPITQPVIEKLPGVIEGSATPKAKRNIDGAFDGSIMSKAEDEQLEKADSNQESERSCSPDSSAAESSTRCGKVELDNLDIASSPILEKLSEDLMLSTGD